LVVLSGNLAVARNDAEKQAGIALEKEERARQEAAKATKARDFLVSILRMSESETDAPGGNITARQILADVEKRIPAEFADQPDLRAALVKAIGEMKRRIARRRLVNMLRSADSQRNTPAGNSTAGQILADLEKRIPVELADQPDARAELLKGFGEVQRRIARRAPRAMLLEVRGKVRLRSAAGVKKAAVPQALVNFDDQLILGADAQVQLLFLADLHKERLKPGRVVTVGLKGCEPADAVQERDNSVLMTFVRLPKGTFYMGGGGGKVGIKTEIKRNFEIAAHHVTQGQWEAIMGHNPSDFSRNGGGRESVKDFSDEELKLFPVENVSLPDAQKFIKKLNKKERGRGYLYRLPTDAEWEYACRGGATSKKECSYHFYFAKPTNELSSEQANFGAQIGNRPARPTRVGAYPPNKLGLYDMHGNVAQYVPGPTGPVVRGGAWWDREAQCRAAWRVVDPNRQYRDHCRGFRLVRVPVR
jgi:formylglycine-generating enzyme required for sulfatase activity